VELSCKTEYAILALLELTCCYSKEEPLQIRQIAAAQNIPDRYLEQLLATLRRGGIVRSQRGAKGGYLLAREPWKINLLEVMCCLEGGETPPSCPDEAPHSAEQIVVREIWKQARDCANAVLASYTLQDLCDRRDSRLQLNLMYYI